MPFNCKRTNKTQHIQNLIHIAYTCTEVVISAINNKTFHSNNEFCNVLRRLKIKLPKYDDFFNTCTLVILKTSERTQNFTKTELVHLHSGQHWLLSDTDWILLSRENVSKRNNCLHWFFLLLWFYNTSQISLHRRPDIFYWIQIRRRSWCSHNTLCQLLLFHPLSSWLTCMLSVVVLQSYTPNMIYTPLINNQI